MFKDTCISLDEVRKQCTNLIKIKENMGESCEEWLESGQNCVFLYVLSCLLPYVTKYKRTIETDIKH